MDGHQLLAKAQNSFQESTSFTLLFTAFAIIFFTRIFSGSSSKTRNGAKTPPVAPYWIPQLGHVPRMVFSAGFSLKRFRNDYPGGIFSIRLLNNIHSIIFRPSLSAALLQQPSSVADEQQIVRRLMVTNFGLSKKDLEAYDMASSELQEANRQLLKESTQDALLKTMLRHLEGQMADLISLNTYPADHMEWERMANADLVEDNGKGKRVMEADLVGLIRNFLVRPTTTAIFGTDFVENFPEIWPFFWTLDESFVTLALNIPVWVPWPRAQKARGAVRKLLDFMYEFHSEMEKHLSGQQTAPKWQDLENVSPLVRLRAQIFRKHDLPLRARAACDLSLLWALNGHSTSLICWTLLELYRDPALLEEVRDDISPYVKIVQPENEFSLAVWIPPKVEKLDLQGLMTDCPLLLSSYQESLRIYGGGWSARYLNEDVVLQDEEVGEKYVLKKGTYAHIVDNLHNTDPKAFPNTMDWMPHRHVKEYVNEKGGAAKKVDMSLVKPYDGGLTLCDDSSLALKKFLTFTSVIISLYDITAPSGKPWTFPGISRSGVSSWPKLTLRAWVKRKEV